MVESWSGGMSLLAGGTVPFKWPSMLWWVGKSSGVAACVNKLLLSSTAGPKTITFTRVLNGIRTGVNGQMQLVFRALHLP